MDLRQLALHDDTLERVRQCFAERVAAGLRADDQQIRALPTYIPPARPTTERAATADKSAVVAVVDVGGTNCRAAVVRPVGDTLQVVRGPTSRALPVRGETSPDATTFFDLQAELLCELRPDAGIPLGYCFSYPAESLPDGDARLIRWTKGLAVAGVVGHRVGKRLSQALHRHGCQPGSVVVLNDTVASLLAGSQQARENPASVVGLIVGTGTNMAGFLRPPKLVDQRQTMAINLESGNFCPPEEIFTEADEAVDAADSPGKQRLEKMVGGHYLPKIFAQLSTSTRGFDPNGSAEQLQKLVERGEGDTEARIAQAILDRSADLVAATLAGLIDHYPAGHRVSIVAEGALFWSGSYAQRVRASLSRLGGQERFSLLRLEHANLVGAASAALAKAAH